MLDVRVIRQYKKDYPYELKAINRLFLYKAVNRVLRAAQDNSPVLSGDLKGSLKGKVQLSKDRAIVGTNLSYAPYVEYGHKIHRVTGPQRAQTFSIFSNTKSNKDSVSAQPYLRPALDKNRRWLVTEWKQLFRKTFRTMGKL